MVNDRYRRGEIIGAGGMSEVYAAEDTVLGRQVAVKMLRPEMARDVNFRERFYREAQNSGKLNHPNIVAVYDTGETELDGMTIPYIVMERVNGRTLARYHSRGWRSVRPGSSGYSQTGSGCTASLARGRDYPPRYQAGEYYAHQHRPGEGDGLRHRPCLG